MRPEPTKVYNSDGYVAVLVSPGFGAGWSTWNNHLGEFLTFDKAFVDLVEQERFEDCETVLELLHSTYPDAGFDEVYTGGFSDCYVRWVEPGTLFRINEYDGSESFESKDSGLWRTA